MHLLERLFIKVSMFLCALCATQGAYAQFPENEMIGTDSMFILNVIREKADVYITLDFRDTLGFEYIAIERKADYDQSFSQCKYFSYKELKENKMKIRRKEAYPLPVIVNVLYRVKLVTDEGIIRLFPPLRLPPTH